MIRWGCRKSLRDTPIRRIIVTYRRALGNSGLTLFRAMSTLKFQRSALTTAPVRGVGMSEITTVDETAAGGVHGMRDRRIGLLLLCVAGLLSTRAVSRAYAEAEGRTETLKSATDGWPIHISYFPVKGAQGAGGNPNAPVVVLLHGNNGDRLVWEKQGGGKLSGLVEVLQQEGYAVVTVDLRKHGQSVVDGQATALVNSDYQNMWRGDLEAVKQFLYEEHQAKRLNLNKLAIVAADMSAPIAATFTEFDWRKPPYDDAPATSPGADAERAGCARPGAAVTESYGRTRQHQ